MAVYPVPRPAAPSTCLLASHADTNNSGMVNPESEISRGPSTISTQTSPRGSGCNHVSGHHIRTASASSSSAAVPPLPHVNASERHAEAPLPQKDTESSQVESGKEEESSLKSEPQDTTVDHSSENTKEEASKLMCIAEPKESRSEVNRASTDKKEIKMHEIPLTLMPSLPAEKADTVASEAESPRNSRKRSTKSGQTAGRWTQEEHQAFLEGLKVFGREWKKVADRIPTRTSAQIRSHAQKYFSKLSREETLMFHEAPQEVAQPVAVPSHDVSHLPSSVQRNVQRILADPTGAQREVEDTLRQLRERYRQLQIRLEESQRRRHGVPHRPMDRIEEDNASESDSLPLRHGSSPGIDRRKRSFEDSSLGSIQPPDDLSSVSSDLSASLASFSPSREFGNEELIALHVLGGTLPRSASGTELQPMENLEENGHSRSSSLSEGDDSETKRRRLESNGRLEQDPERDPDGDHMMN